MFDDARDPAPPPRPRRLPWVVAAVLALATLAAASVATFLYVDRQRLRDQLEDERARLAIVRAERDDARTARSELERQVEDLIGLGEGALATTQACRDAVREAVAMWNDLVRALNAAAEPDPEEFERFARSAERSRDRVNRSLEACEG